MSSRRSPSSTTRLSSSGRSWQTEPGRRVSSVSRRSRGSSARTSTPRSSSRARRQDRRCALGHRVGIHVVDRRAQDTRSSAADRRTASNPGPAHGQRRVEGWSFSNARQTSATTSRHEVTCTPTVRWPDSTVPSSRLRRSGRHVDAVTGSHIRLELVALGFAGAACTSQCLRPNAWSTKTSCGSACNASPWAPGGVM